MLRLLFDHHIRKANTLHGDAKELRLEAERHRLAGNEDEYNRLMDANDYYLGKARGHIDKAKRYF